MYKHIVFWKLKVNSKSRKDLCQQVKLKLDSLPNKIPEIIEYETAINIGNYDASFFDISLISSFKDEVDFWKYTKYPEHDEVVNFIKSIQDTEQIVDYETNVKI